MEHDVPKETLNLVVDLLCNNDKEGALLAYYRASDKTLDQTWDAIQHILMDLGEDINDQPQQADKDFSYSIVQYYLKNALAKPSQRAIAWFRENILVIAIFLICLALSALRIVPSSIKVTNEIRSWSWPSTEATVITAKQNGSYRSTRPPYTSWSYLDMTFQYEVEGQEYTDRRKKVRYSDSDQFSKPGDVFSIAYNPNRPTLTVYEGEIGIVGILTHLLAIAIGLIPLVVCICIGSFIVSMERDRKRLARLDRQIKRQENIRMAGE